MSRILITGAAGFIGSHLADRFLAAGHQVRGIDNLTTGNKGNVGEWEFFVGDIAAADFNGRFGDLAPDVIVHCAASYDDREKWHRDVTTNVQGAINVAILARECGARVVYFQTALVYGNNPLAAYFADGYLPGEVRPLRVDHSIAPENSYAVSKYAAEQYLKHSGVPLLTFRLANIYGPRNLSGPVPTFHKRLSEGQSCTVVDSRRDFVYIQDLVDLVDQAIGMEATGTYHVSTGRDYTIHELFTTVANAMDIYDATPLLQPRGEDDAPTILLDPTETKRDFGWQATTDLDEGIEQAVAWYADNPVTETYTHLAVKG